MMKSETLAQRAKKQLVKGFLYWLWRYISIFLASAFVIVLIAITIGMPFYMIFGNGTKWLPGILGASMGCLTAITVNNITRYQNCWLSMKINFIRFKTIKTIEKIKLKNWSEMEVQKYINSELKNVMEDFRAI